MSHFLQAATTPPQAFALFNSVRSHTAHPSFLFNSSLLRFFRALYNCFLERESFFLEREMEEIDEARAKATASEPTNTNPNTELAEKPSKAKEEGELSSNDADDDDKDNNNNVLFSKTLVHIQTFS